MFTNLKRILKFAVTDFFRNRGGSFAGIFVLVITISLMTSLFLFQGVSRFLISQVQEKIDISAYFNEDATEEDVLNVKTELSRFSSEIKDVQYISKEEALDKFVQRHKDNLDFMKALEEVGENPFLASLNIKTRFPSQYEKISNFLETGEFSNLIEKVDYYQKKPTIEKVFSATSAVNRFGIGLSIVLALVTVLVVFNTIKLAIYNSKEEIGTMRLVGASNWFIRGPFIVQGAICGFVAFLICILATGFLTFFLGPRLEVLLPGFNLFNYFLVNFWVVFLIQVIFGIGLGIVSSFIVVKKYLKD